MLGKGRGCGDYLALRGGDVVGRWGVVVRWFVGVVEGERGRLGGLGSG